MTLTTLQDNAELAKFRRTSPLKTLPAPPPLEDVQDDKQELAHSPKNGPHT
ncbi:hypothetical protein BDV37DRAFT_283127 [Aspergillus pseudonomiae]|uniref:Uncharacterized protein n=1 Tax=Aspergillus pseudonomiae TaxID=1506151 RepID=A0A5N7DC83_9EURO|nr:uncharacterized protein BDV37DRAFT_283127 [Aspergillus pseudonomiae]KAE8404080.1 hypothetical protein BDV37DRAFT_283127 [Aspergillus pseudonomiae]